MPSDAIPQQSRAATGVKLQRLDTGDRLTEVVLIPPAAAEDEDGTETPELDSETMALPAATAEPASEAADLTSEEDS